MNAGVRPGSRGPFGSAKGPKTIDTQFSLTGWDGRRIRKADQLAALKQGPPMIEERPPLGPNSRRRLERKKSVRVISEVWPCNHEACFRFHSSVPPRDNPLSHCKTQPITLLSKAERLWRCNSRVIQPPLHRAAKLSTKDFPPFSK
jgi:hypothetical protein